MKMKIRVAALEDAKKVAGLAVQMWESCNIEELAQELCDYMSKESGIVFLAIADECVVGFAQCGLRHDYVEGTDSSPVCYLEGIFVKEEYRNRGLARDMLEACQKWAKEQGCTEFASDCELDNEDSLKFHMKMGFAEANRIICFTKRLTCGDSVIREIFQDDITHCVNVIRESFRTVAEEFGFTEENAPGFTAFSIDEDRINWHLNGEHRSMYGYFEEGKLVGYYSLLIQDNQECELNNLCVLPDYRHKQIGCRLLKNAFENARNMNCTKMNIGIVEENQVLRKWYESYGFVHIRTEKYDFFPFTCGYLVKDLT